MSELYKHAFPKLLLENNKPLAKKGAESIKKQIKETGDFRVKNPEPLSLAEFYHYEVFSYSTRLLSALDRMDETQVYIRNFPRVAALKKKGITEDKWIEYHYCNYLVTLSGVYDIALILSGAVFRLGIDPKHCNEKIITDNRWIKSTPVKPSLVALHKTIAPHKKDRNLYVHHGEVPTIELIDDLKMFSIAESSGGVPIVDPTILRAAYSLATKGIIEGMESKLKEVRMATSKLFDVLLPFYQRTVESLTLTHILEDHRPKDQGDAEKQRASVKPSDSKPRTGK